MEAAIPERFFNDFTKCNAPGADATTTPPYDATKPACAEGISTVKAIAIAASQGQKIFTITSANAAQALPLLSHRVGVMDEIQNAISAGKEVQIHESTITANGWTGTGYVIIDPETGAGGYLIEGGANGAFFAGFGLGAAAGAAIIMMIVATTGLAVLAATLTFIAVFSLILMNMQIFSAEKGCVLTGTSTGLGVLSTSAAFKAELSVYENRILAIVFLVLGTALQIPSGGSSLSECLG